MTDLYLQRTLRTSISAQGVGVHSGELVCITLRPAPENTGVVFRRIDFDTAIEIPASLGYVHDTVLSTCLKNGEAQARTVEHLLSAVAGLGLDNLYVDLDKDERVFHID